MKRWIALLLMLMMLTLPANAEEYNWYLKTGLGLALDMCELAHDETYLDMMSGMDFDVLDAIPENTDDFGSVWLVRLLVSPQTLASLMGLAGEPLSETAMEQVTAKFPGTVVAMLNSAMSVEAVAAATMTAATRTFPMPSGGFEGCILAVDLNGVMACAAFMITGEDTVTVTCQPVFLAEGETAQSKLNHLATQYPIELIQIF